MPRLGDRVIIEGSKVGQQRREGSLIGMTGRLLNVRWNDGTTSLLTPGAGSVRFVSKGSNGSTAAKRSPKKKAAGSGKKVANGAVAKATPAAKKRKAAAKTAAPKKGKKKTSKR